MLAISIQFIYAVVTFNVVVMAMQLVTEQQGCTLVGAATLVPMARVGVAFDEHGTQMVAKMASVTGTTPH
jgi:hypothetical protein